MTSEKQRIAIAEACPAAFRVYEWGVYFKNSDGVFIPWTNDNDLNAMHEAEKVLAPRQKVFYQSYIHPVETWEWTHATAAQRAEAFLRTLNLWKD